MQRKKYKRRDTNNSMDDEFGFNYDISEDDYNKLRAKEQKKSMPQTKKVKRKKKKKQTINHFKGLGSSSRGPWPKFRE